MVCARAPPEMVTPPRSSVCEGGHYSNHPKLGPSTLAPLIRNLNDIRATKKILASKPRDLLLFTMAINNGIKTADLLKPEIPAIKSAKPNQAIQIKESKTRKTIPSFIHREAHKARGGHLDALTPKNEDYRACQIHTTKVFYKLRSFLGCAILLTNRNNRLAPGSIYAPRKYR